MFEVLKDSLNSWNVQKSERQKLQHAYLALTVMVVLLAGIISLFDGELGHNIVLTALFAIATYFMNAIVWNLLQSSLLDKLASKPKRK